MERHRSSSSSTTLPGRSISARSPAPWEVAQIPKVPYMLPDAQPLSTLEKQALTSLWAVRSSDGCGYSTHTQSQINSPTRSASFPPPVSPNTHSSPWTDERYTRYNMPPTPPSPTRSVSAPATKQAPPTLPAYERTYTPPPSAEKLPVIAMSGTMSSRPIRATRSQSPGGSRLRSMSNKANRRKQEHQRPKTTPFGSRLRSAMRDMFKRDPVDETSFERIEDRHWTE
jgi:hypothetical protein